MGRTIALGLCVGAVAGPFPATAAARVDAGARGSGDTGSSAAVRSSPRPLGIDVSHYQGEIGWRSVRRGGYRFAFHKATEGTDLRDPRFTRERWASMRRARLARGAYHFARPSAPITADASTEARRFLAAVRSVGGIRRGDLPLVLDIEASRLTPAGTVAWVGRWTQTVKRSPVSRTGRPVRCIIYTSPALWASLTGNTARNFGCRLWIAHYGVAQPTVPRAWRSWDLWQFSNRGRVPGVFTPVDLDRARSARRLRDILVR